MSGERQSHVCDTEQSATRQKRIRSLNDQLRRTMIGGHVVITQGIEALGLINVTSILQEIRQFDDFTASNDPFDEHDFGALAYMGQRVLWKIDYYDNNLEFGSPDPSDPAVTSRMITIMLASEY